tara:strand:- start:209480 stop:210205 length:726 start_codon:yes stop_codon:yes gene_type:complete
MTDTSTANRSSRLCVQLPLILCVALASCALCGCKDGPLYALKTVNPYFTMREWREDEALGVTDHERLQQLQQLSEQIGGMTAERQAFWAGHLTRIMENDPSPEMRRLAVVAAGKINNETSLQLVEKGLDDESLKVRLFACEALGDRPGDSAARLLASTAGTETDEDVRQAALTALANHKSPIAVDALRIALSDRNPATRDLAMNSLRNVTGKNYGTSPDQWIAALDKGSDTVNPSTDTIRR